MITDYEKINETEIDKALTGFPQNLDFLIRESIDNEYPRKKIIAREILVHKGKSFLPQIHTLLESKNVMLRMEAVKIVELIGDRRSVPFLINLLNDNEFEIRWIAAEGLIRIGRRSILPLIKSIRDGKSSFFLNRSAHQVLINILYENERERLTSFLLCLEDTHELGETAPVQAALAVKIFRKHLL
jgi:hypothetical protein